MPIIARRPLLISAMSDFSLASLERFLFRPNGSYSSSGTGCGMPPLLNDGNTQGFPLRARRPRGGDVREGDARGGQVPREDDAVG